MEAKAGFVVCLKDDISGTDLLELGVVLKDRGRYEGSCKVVSSSHHPSNDSEIPDIHQMCIAQYCSL